MDLIIQPAKKEDVSDVISLLSENELPTIDIESDVVKIFVAYIEGNIVASIGIEMYGKVGLLRSLAVKNEFKNQGLGGKMVDYFFNYCVAENINEVFLLTTTAEKYFEKYGFYKIDRFEVPDAIKQTREFKDICPVSAAVMRKAIVIN